MTQTYHIRHRTWMVYQRPVTFARCNVRLRPIDWPDQTLISYHLEFEPGGQLTTQPARGGSVNLSRLVIAEATTWLDITSQADVRVERPVPMPLASDPSVAEVGRLARETSDASDLSPANYLYPSPHIPADAAIAEWALTSLAPDRPVIEAAFDLSWRIWLDFRFDGCATIAETPPSVAFAGRAGVCQDFAQIMICGLRAAGLPAAYASGYIRNQPPPGEAKLMGSDAMHGWVMVWCGPTRGWIGFDPTNGIFMAEDHVLVAIGRDYLDIAPVDGIFTGYGTQSVKVEVDMYPLA